MVPPHAASLALEQDSLTVTLGIVRDIVTEVRLLHFPYNHLLSDVIKHQIMIYCYLSISGMTGGATGGACLRPTRCSSPQVSLSGQRIQSEKVQKV